MVRSNVSWLIVTGDPACEHTDMTENITLPKLRWQVVKKHTTKNTEIVPITVTVAEVDPISFATT